MKYSTILCLFFLLGVTATSFAQEIELIDEPIVVNTKVQKILLAINNQWVYNEELASLYNKGNSKIDKSSFPFTHFTVRWPKDIKQDFNKIKIETEKEFPIFEVYKIHAFFELVINEKVHHCILSSHGDYKVYLSYVEQKNTSNDLRTFNIDIKQEGNEGPQMLYMIDEKIIGDRLVEKMAFFSDPYIHYHPTKKNITAAHLIGTWKYDKNLAKILGIKEDPIGTVSFKLDTTILSKIPLQYYNLLKEKKIYLAGTMTFKKIKGTFPFLITEYEGSPYLFYFRGRQGDSYGDSESFYLNVIPGATKKQDLLFLGGDFAREPFMPFNRSQ